MEVFTDFASHSTDTVSHRARKMGAARGRSEKNAIRVCGDWSEQLSSKGKIYFYNCMTEVSQWQKPPEWKLPDMNSEELLRLLESREPTLDGKCLKRQRVSASTMSSLNKETASGDRCASPKRSKYSHEMTDRCQMGADFSPSSRDAPALRPVCTTGPPRYAQRLRATSRTSPKVNHLELQNCISDSQSRKHFPNNLSSRLPPTDDMEISPNSSPMSCGSSPQPVSRSLSPRVSKYSSADSRNVLCPPKGYTSKSHETRCDGACPQISDASNAGTLRQLVDAIRASIGGLLDRSPTSAGKQTASPRTTSQRELRYSSCTMLESEANHHSLTFSHSSCGDTRESVQARSPKRPMDKHRSVSSSSKSSLLSGRTNLTPLLPIPSFESRQEPRQTSSQDKVVPGLVSTLTTLVNLIGSSNYSNNPVQHSPLSCTAPTTVNNSHSALLRTPSKFSTSHHHSHMTSPLIPSPATPTTNSVRTFESTSANSTRIGGTHGPPTNHINGLLSNLRVFYQPSQTKPSKPTIEYYQPPKSLLHNSTDYHANYSGCEALSPKDSPRLFSCFHPQQLDTADSTDPSKLSQSSENSRCLSDSLDEAPAEFYRNPHSFSSSGPINRASYASPNSGFPQVAATIHTRSEYSEDFVIDRHGSPSADDEPVITRSLNDPGPSSFQPIDEPSPVDRLIEDDDCITRINAILISPETQSFVDSYIVSKYSDKSVERLEHEAFVEARKFEKLQSVLYGELSAESKKLRALVRISEAKLAIHREKQTSLQELMDAIETRKQLPNLSFSDDAL